MTHYQTISSALARWKRAGFILNNLKRWLKKSLIHLWLCLTLHKSTHANNGKSTIEWMPLIAGPILARPVPNHGPSALPPLYRLVAIPHLCDVDLVRGRSACSCGYFSKQTDKSFSQQCRSDSLLLSAGNMLGCFAVGKVMAVAKRA